jgi:hypothetical protein
LARNQGGEAEYELDPSSINSLWRRVTRSFSSILGAILLHRIKQLRGTG